MESKLEKWALFDFCETVANFQTANAYVDFVCAKKSNFRIYILSVLFRALNKFKVFRLCDALSGKDLYLLKRFKLYLLKGLNENELEEFAREYYEKSIKHNFITPLVDRLNDLKNRGYKILVVSGGYSIYIHYFVKDYNLDGYIANEIKFIDGKCAGILEGVNCMNENKPMLLDLFFKDKPLYTEAYSDSITDIPFLKWANRGIVISRYQSQTWSKQNGFEEIVW